MLVAAAVNVAVAPAQRVWVSGLVVTDGRVSTVRVAAVVVAVEQTLVKTARYCLVLSAATVANESVVEVAPGMLLNVVPPSVETCHCTVGLGLPEAAAVKVAVPPAQTSWLVGFVVTLGATLTVRVAAVVVEVPQKLVKTARNWWPLSAAVAENE